MKCNHAITPPCKIKKSRNVRGLGGGTWYGASGPSVSVPLVTEYDYWGQYSDYMQLSLEPQKALYSFFTYTVVLPKTCEHTLKLLELPFT